MEVTMSKVTATLTCLLVVVCCVHAEKLNLPRMGRASTLAFARLGRSNVLAFPRMGRSPGLYFPRMGRSYLAMPRMGRSSDVTAPPTDCCGIGFKKLAAIGSDDKPEAVNHVCSARECCEGLREAWESTTLEGVMYSLCLADPETERSRASVYDKLKRLIP